MGRRCLLRVDLERAGDRSSACDLDAVAQRNIAAVDVDSKRGCPAQFEVTRNGNEPVGAGGVLQFDEAAGGDYPADELELKGSDLSVRPQTTLPSSLTWTPSALPSLYPLNSPFFNS